MDSTLALGAFRIARGAGGEAVDVNGNLVEREKHHLNLHLTSEWAVPRVAVRFSDSETSWVLAGGAEGSFLCSLSSRFSGRGGGVGSLPRAWRRVGVPPRLYGFHWHSEPFESQGARAAKRYVNGNLVEREKGDEFGIETTAPPISPWISPWNISPTHDS